MKQKIMICVGLLAGGLLNSEIAAAQGAYPAATALPPYEIVAIVRSTGIEPLSRPVRHGPNYTLHAVDPAGHPVRVVVDARLGRIVGVSPVHHPRFAAPVLPSPYARPAAPVATVPDGYGPASRITVLPPSLEHTNTIPSRGRSPPASSRSTNAAGGETGPAPLPRPRPKLAAGEPTVGGTGDPPVESRSSANAGTNTVQAKNQVPPTAPVVEQHE